MIHCLIVDDEPIARSIIEKYVLKTPGLQLSGQLDNALDVIEYLKSHEVDLLFLDINMPGITGIDLLKSLYKPPHVIITTAYSEYGAESYNFDVVDYLLKPIPFERFLKAIQKLEKSTSEHALNQDDEFIFLKEDQTTHKVLVKDIRYVEAYGNYVKVHTSSSMLIVRSTLQKIISEVSETLIQIHKSYLVSKNFIQSLDRESVLLDGEVRLPISNSYRGKIQSEIKGS